MMTVVLLVVVATIWRGTCRHHPTRVAESKKMANVCGHVRVLIGYQT